MKDRWVSAGRRLLGTVVVATLPLLTACGADDGATTTGRNGSGTRSHVLVELATSGGEDGRGVGDLVVSPGGEAQLRGPQGDIETTTLTPDELTTLVAALNDADFAGVPAEPDVEDVCPDALVYTVIYQRWDVTADSCTIPDELAPSLDELQTILSRFT